MTDWRWYCAACHRDLGPVVGKHSGKCPTCGCKSAYATHDGSDANRMQMKLELEADKR